MRTSHCNMNNDKILCDKYTPMSFSLCVILSMTIIVLKYKSLILALKTKQHFKTALIFYSFIYYIYEMFLHAIYLDDKKRKFYFDSTWTFDNPNNSTKCMMGNIIHDEVFKLKYYENVKFSIKATILYWPHHGLLSICVLWMYIIRNVLAMDVYHAISKEEFDINRSYYIKWNPLVEINCDINRIN